MRKYIHIGCGNWGQTWLNRIIPQTADIGQCVAAVDINGESSQEIRRGARPAGKRGLYERRRGAEGA